jgi:hypothetical protein
MVSSILYIAVSNHGEPHEVHITRLIGVSATSLVMLLFGIVHLFFSKSLQTAAWRQYENSPTWLKRRYSPARLEFMKSPDNIQVRWIFGMMVILGAIVLMLLVLFGKTG